MAYLSSKKIFPGNWAEPLNGWYKNIDTTEKPENLIINIYKRLSQNRKRID